MPRVGDEFLDSVFYLYRSVHEAKEGINIGGSGFLVSVPTETIEKGGFVYAVTNRHVIEKADVLRLNTKEGGLHIEQLGRANWFKSETDDLAICPIRLPPDIYAHKHVPLKAIMSKEQAEKSKVGIGDNVFMVGRFINHEGKQKNAPLVRFGAIAQMLGEPLAYELEGKPHEQESIIADIRSIGGYSGSPVFLNEMGFISRPDGAEKITTHWLIGVDWGHIKMWSPVCGFNEEPIGDAQVNINSGMAGVVPSWKLLELLMSDDQKERRKRGEARYNSAKTSAPAATDLYIPSPASDQKDSAQNAQDHKPRFDALVRAAATTKSSSD